MRGDDQDRVLDLFAGAGGWSLAVESLGLNETGVENNPNAVATRTAAGFKTHEVGDVWEFDFHEATGLYEGLVASPPCQTFSRAGKGKGVEDLRQVLTAIEFKTYQSKARLRRLGDITDPRTALVLMPLHAVYVMRPRFVALEQVPTVLPVWEAVAEEMREMGYHVWTGVLHSEQYGVPQTRDRAILIASLDHEVGMPQATHSRYHKRSPERLDEGVPRWVTMSEALGWGISQRPSPTVTGGGTETGGAEPIAHWSRYTGRPDFVAMGDVYNSHGCIRDINQPPPTLTASMDNGNFRWIPQPANEDTTQQDMGWVKNRPSPTIVGTFAPDVVAAPGYRKAGDGPRQKAKGSVRVSVEEAGVLQSFPRDFPWQGSKTSQYLQVGNAIPPLLAEAVLREALGLRTNTEGNTNGETQEADD